MPSPAPFWKTKTLDEMSRDEWEALCDGCGRCCLEKLIEDETGRLMYTNVACRLLNLETCRCTRYPVRRNYVPECVDLTPAKLREINWLPPSCAYRCIDEGRELPSWHPLVTGDPESVHQAGASVRGRAVCERNAGPLEHHIVIWPGQMPKRRGTNK